GANQNQAAYDAEDVERGARAGRLSEGRGVGDAVVDQNAEGGECDHPVQVDSQYEDRDGDCQRYLGVVGTGYCGCTADSQCGRSRLWDMARLVRPILAIR